MLNKKQYTFLDKGISIILTLVANSVDNIAMFQELALLSVKFCVKVFQIFLKDVNQFIENPLYYCIDLSCH